MALLWEKFMTVSGLESDNIHRYCETLLPLVAVVRVRRDARYL